MKNLQCRGILVGFMVVCVVGMSQTVIIYPIDISVSDFQDTVWLQIPQNYDSTRATPLLFGCHGLGGDQTQMATGTRFDEQANLRGWLCASMRGPNVMHWNNHIAQTHMVEVLNWIAERYNVDRRRVYMVGGSMGGAAGMVFHNNHLDPNGWMVAATASGSGIMDCHRRFLEQGINHSMIQAFGGFPDSVPYQYHRNSAVYFADLTQSMHYNLRHLPMYYTFGYMESPWMNHAVDLYNLIQPIADEVYLVMASWVGHGWDSMDEVDICNWLQNFTLNDNPNDISINTDENGRCYWVEVQQWDTTEAFTRFDATYNSSANLFTFHGFWNLRSALLDFNMMGINPDEVVQIFWTVDDTIETLILPNYVTEPSGVLKNGIPTADWNYSAESAQVSIISDTGFAVWEIYPAPQIVPSKNKQNSPLTSTVLATYPNPFNPILRVTYQVPIAGDIKLQVFNVLGREVATLAQGHHLGGTYRTAFDGRNYASGIYFVRLDTPIEIQTAKVVLIR
jgi:pimeloyl-ACP methyl ester carboxylesterase